jgi:maltose alpha-D-glucosyltransferase/alpha-amylase
VTFRAEDEEGPEILLVNLLSDEHSRGDARGRHTVMLEPYGYRWFRIGGLDYLLKRSEV